jgi:hypothetical protein
MKVVRNRVHASSILVILFAVALAGCATRQVPSDADKAVVKRFDNLRGMRYCEVFLIGGTIFPKNLQAAFYNTTDLNNAANPRNTCPADLWAKVDADSLKKEYDVWGVFKNGPRGWTMDWIKLPTGPVRTFDGLQAQWMGQVQLPKDVELGKKGSTAYKPTEVHRESEMTFEKGKPVFILDDPEGTPWVMQASSAIVDPNLTYDQLDKLGDKLKPAPGWKYRVVVVDRDLTIKAVDGVAHIVQDELENTYDQCFSDACTYKP